MKLPRRKLLHLAAGAAALPTISRIASALDYPTRPVRYFGLGLLQRRGLLFWCERESPMSAFGIKADVTRTQCDVRL